MEERLEMLEKMDELITASEFKQIVIPVELLKLIPFVLDPEIQTISLF